MSKYRILALDGGGIGGLVTAKLLYNLCRKPGLERVFESADLIAGNSSGGLIALAMAHGLGETKMVNTLAKIVAVFESGEKVFGQGLPLWLGGFWLFSKHGTRAREEAFRGALGTTTLGDFQRKVLITTFDLDDEAKSESKHLGSPANSPMRRWRPKLFHNFVRLDDPHADRERKIRKPDREHFAWEVALYTTAAPSYFPSVDGYIDGGVYANNPSMCALAQAFDERYEGAATRQLRDIALLSVSAGRNATFIKQKTLRGGALWWGTRYVGITMDGTVGVADYECAQMLGSSGYRRLNADFPAGMKVKLDDVKKVGELKTFADAIPVEEDAQWLRQNWLAGDQPDGRIPKQGAIPMTDTTSKHLLGTTELTCLMPIKSGFVGEFETRTYATRLRIAMKVLNAFRASSREFAPARVFPDIVDVIRSIHAFQLSVVGANQLLLAVTFDGPWEAYMRFVWKGLGPLLDLLLINCVDYEAYASDKGFDRFSDWVRRHQIDTGLFYAGSGHSVDDIRYLTQLERAQRNEACPEKFDKAAALLVARDAITEAKEAAQENPEQTVESGLRAIAAFYGLRESYPNKTPQGVELPDARYLLRAARETLKAFDTKTISTPRRLQFRSELEWFEKSVAEPPKAGNRQPAYEEMQGGILPGERRPANVGKSRAAHGCLLLARVVNPAVARTFLGKELINYVSRHHGDRPHDIDTNIAFTFGGLKRMGVSAADLASLPKEFREGMEARAGMLGDVRSNHPTNWSLPEWNWASGKQGAGAAVRLSTIDLVVKMRIAGPEGKAEHAWSAKHPLYDFATKLFADPNKTGIQVMSVQPMLHHVDAAGATVIDHFGFVDGISQPRLDPDGDPTKGEWNNQVALGELFLGYHNDRTDPAFLEPDDPDALPGRHVGSLLDNGTFLVVRKLEQHVGALYEVLDEFLDANKDLGWTRGEVQAKLAGRQLNGEPTTADPNKETPLLPGNTFTYKDDDGSRCPLHAHIRRANPREGRVPRIMRRGMSYGPRFDNPYGGERGLMFLAYNASIAEQFEVIQRWLAGGNSTGGFSGHADPFLGVPQKGEQGIFRFVHDEKVRRLDLGDRPFVELKWGMYLFVPSISAIKAIATEPKLDTGAAKALIAMGERIIAFLQTDDDWSAILEDISASSSGQNLAVYAALRARGGVLRTPGRSMVLVASEPLVREVLGNDDVFSVHEYKRRMAPSIGEVYLGLDYSEQYVRRSKVNALVSDIDEKGAFRVASAATREVLKTMLAKGGGRPIPITLEVVADQVLAQLSKYWFGIPNDVEIIAGGRPKNPGDVHLPYHSFAPSRYIFSSPFPRDMVTAAGQRDGKQLRNAVAGLAEAKGIAGFPSPLAQQLWEMTPDESGAPKSDVFARMLVGFIEGFLPTVYGNFLKTMHGWVSDETLWRVQQDLRSDGAPEELYERAREMVKPALQRAMQRKPVPDIVYRTATQRHKLGGETIEAGERVVVLIASATQEMAARPFVGPDVTLVFGGDRKKDPHPTHACPAYDMGIGVLMGMLSAILEATTLTPTESPQVVQAVWFNEQQQDVDVPEGVTAG